MKKLLCLILSIVFMGLNLQSVFASTNNDSFSNEYLNYLDSIYSKKDVTKAFDNNGKDVTNLFFLETEKYYAQKNYIAINRYIYDNISDLVYYEDQKESILRMGITQTVSGRGLKKLEKNGHKVLIGVFISGKMVYDPNSGEILSAYGTTIDDLSVMDGGGYNWNVEYIGLTTSNNISSDRLTVTYTAGCEVIVIDTTSGFTQQINFGRIPRSIRADAGGVIWEEEDNWR